MATTNLAIIEEQMYNYASECVEKKKKGWGWFRGRAHYKPECETEARAKFAKDLEAAQQEELEQQNIVNSAFNNTISAGSNSTLIYFLIGLGVLLFLFWLFM